MPMFTDSPLRSRPPFWFGPCLQVPFWYPPPAGTPPQAAEAVMPHPDLEFVRVLQRPASVATFRRELLGLHDGEGGAAVTAGHDGTAGPTVPAGQPQDEGIHLGGNWTELDLIREGRPFPGAEAAYPGSLAILRAATRGLGHGGGGGGSGGGMPGAQHGGSDGGGGGGGGGWGFINARISVVHPGTHITPHCGVTNARLRTHLGLHVPAPDLLLDRPSGLKSGLRVHQPMA